MRHFLTALVASLALLSLGCGESKSRPVNPSNEPLLLAVAASAAPAIEALGRAFAEQTDIPVSLSVGSSGLLKQQAENGAPFDLFFSADMRRVEDLAASGVILPDSVRPYGEGVLVLWCEGEMAILEEWIDLDRPPFDTFRIAIANPETAPYGLAAKQTLENAGLYDRLLDSGRLIVAGNVRQAYEFAETGNCEAAFVSRSLLISEKRIGGILRATDKDDHLRIVHGCGIFKESKRVEIAEKFQEFALSEKGAEILAENGFESMVSAK